MGTGRTNTRSHVCLGPKLLYCNDFNITLNFNLSPQGESKLSLNFLPLLESTFTVKCSKVVLPLY